MMLVPWGLGRIEPDTSVYESEELEGLKSLGPAFGGGRNVITHGN